MVAVDNLYDKNLETLFEKCCNIQGDFHMGGMTNGGKLLVIRAHTKRR